ncbi:hypothetical protein Cyast_1643 [Cyanobacterium stanieri PCC 7202]|uniref:Serine protease n=1 Tax=Cyanobacterium stanieri (strain ATCC 29140 / PCC 7202) TaxID=292563 RepID=K9YL47_CYASC|nr:hypothetical protein Cyast_1643 [Cyanobacterium stanieri PCC 7202]
MDNNNFTIGIIEGDSRGIVPASDVFPFSSVVTLDAQFENNRNSNVVGTGVMITPNHVLTAGHVVYNPRRFNNPIPTAVRATPSALQGELNSRVIGNELDPSANVNGINYLLDFDQVSGTVRGLTPFDRDIALLTTNDNPAPLAPDEVVGIVTFVDPQSALGLGVSSAGFPSDGRTIGDNSTMARLNGRTLVQSPKPGLGLDPQNPDTGSIRQVGDRTRGSNDEFIDLERIIYFSFDIDVEGGQSGSPVWHILQGDTTPRVLGLITGSLTRNPMDLGIDFGNSGILITTDIYNNITTQLEQDGWGEWGNVLPENAIVGSNENDLIIGSFRRERIIGAGGENLLFGGGGDDRLEGGAGIDLALFAEPVENYTIIIEDLENGIFTIEHTGGSQTEGRNLLTNIEMAVFGYDINLSAQEQNNLSFLPLNIEPNQDILTNLSDRFPSIANINELILPREIYQPTVANTTPETSDSLFHNNNSPPAPVHNNPFASLFSGLTPREDAIYLSSSGIDNTNHNPIPWLESNSLVQPSPLHQSIFPQTT